MKSVQLELELETWFLPPERLVCTQITPIQGHRDNTEDGTQTVGSFWSRYLLQTEPHTGQAPQPHKSTEAQEALS
jgi:hypothetical protein